MMILLPLEAGTESLTLTTYYPAPYGVYQEMRVTQNTFLAYANAANMVGIGTTDTTAGGRAWKLLVANGPSYFSNYIRVGPGSGCRWVPIPATGLTSCGATEYATWHPGVYQEGTIRMDYPRIWTVDLGGPRFESEYAEGGGFYCCAK